MAQKLRALRQLWQRPAPLRTLRRRSWRAHASLLPWLHALDPDRPSNTCVNLHVLWLKALAGARGDTDDALSYRILPKSSRWLISRPLCFFFPPWHHDTIARRTRFLDAAIADLIDGKQRAAAEAAAQTTDVGMHATDGGRPAPAACSVHLITLGAGFDTRPLRVGLTEDVWRRKVAAPDCS